MELCIVDHSRAEDERAETYARAVQYVQRFKLLGFLRVANVGMLGWSGPMTVFVTHKHDLNRACAEGRRGSVGSSRIKADLSYVDALPLGGTPETNATP